MELFDVYSLYDIEPVRAHGNYVYTADGTEYLDLYGGHAVISIGHTHPHYVDAVCRQAAALPFYSNSVKNSLQDRLAGLLGNPRAVLKRICRRNRGRHTGRCRHTPAGRFVSA